MKKWVLFLILAILLMLDEGGMEPVKVYLQVKGVGAGK
jgi:hypothetical protein